MNGPYYVSHGRDICRDGKVILDCRPVATSNGRYTVGTPADADDLVAHIVALLNKASPPWSASGRGRRDTFTKGA